jgi:DNA-binding NarL/FixJ family response regulator
MDSELTSVEPIRRVEELRRWAPNCPILIYSGAQQREWQEEAYLQGVAHVLAKPVSGRLINTLLERLLFAPSPVIQTVYNPPAAPEVRPSGIIQNLRPTLEVLRDISSILRHSLCSEALLQEFLLRLR